MEKITINANNHRYLSELDEFKNGLPFGVLNKTKTDVGGTYVAANCDSNYIIVCPFRDLVDSIASDTNNKYEVFKCYGGSKKSDFKDYIKSNSIYKIACTYDSLPKLVEWIGDIRGFKVLVDEYHLILEDMDFRTKAIDGLMNEIKKFDYYTFLSATPIECEYEIDFIKNLPHYKVEWDNMTKITPLRFRTKNLVKGLARFIQIFLEEGVTIPNVDGEVCGVKELYVFINSVTSIKQIVDTLELSPDEVKICCADRIRNGKILGEYEIESVSSPNKRINFFTKKCFQGCNLFTKNGLIIIASDAYRTQTLVDISTTLEQIAGRIRFNANDVEKQNIFRNTLIHMYSTNSNIPSDEEFSLIMDEKERDAQNLIDMTKNYTIEQMNVFLKRVNLESDIVSVIDNRLEYNVLKRQSFIYKQGLKKAYANGISVSREYAGREKFVEVEESKWEDLNIKMAKAITVNYKDLLKDYMENPSETYELEYPEFKEIVKYLKESEMNTLRWNKEKMMQRVEELKMLDKVFLEIHTEGFISSKDLKARMSEAFNKYGLTLTAKATLIEKCTLYNVENKVVKIDGKSVKGYNLGPKRFIFNF